MTRPLLCKCMLCLYHTLTNKHLHTLITRDIIIDPNTYYLSFYKQHPYNNVHHPNYHGVFNASNYLRDPMSKRYHLFVLHDLETMVIPVCNIMSYW